MASLVGGDAPWGAYLKRDCWTPVLLPGPSTKIKLP
jgi:hypothetical protein